MKKAPVGALVSLFFDGRELAAGDYLRTPSGRLYRVVHRRVQQRGKHKGRQHLRCLVSSEVAPGARIVELRWYARGKGKRLRSSRRAA